MLNHTRVLTAIETENQLTISADECDIPEPRGMEAHRYGLRTKGPVRRARLRRARPLSRPVEVQPGEHAHGLRGLGPLSTLAAAGDDRGAPRQRQIRKAKWTETQSHSGLANDLNIVGELTSFSNSHDANFGRRAACFDGDFTADDWDAWQPDFVDGYYCCAGRCAGDYG